MLTHHVRDLENFERIEIGGKTVLLPNPSEIPEFKFIGRKEIIDKALAAWLEIDGLKPLNFRLFGPPGMGKNAVVYELARLLKKDLYIINGHDELGPEDIACSATVTSRSDIEYVASPLFAAMLRGGICLFDEIGKVPSRALAPLAPVLDDRRSLTSVLAGIHLRARNGFFFCAALNEDEEEGIGLPEFIDERTRPSIYVGYPRAKDMEEILRNQVSANASLWVEVFADMFRDKELSTRDALIIFKYAYKLCKSGNGNSKTGREKMRDYLTVAYESNHRGSNKDVLHEDERQGVADDFHKFVEGSEDTIH